MSVSLLLAFFLTEIISIQGYLQFWMRYLSEMFQRHSFDICTLVPNNLKFLVCLSVCQLAYFLTEIIKIQGYLRFWKRYLSEISWRHSWDVCTLFKTNQNFLYVCVSVRWLTSLLKLDKYKDISRSEIDISLNFFGDNPRMLLHHFQIILNFLYVCQSVSWHTSLLKLGQYRQIVGKLSQF